MILLFPIIILSAGSMYSDTDQEGGPSILGRFRNYGDSSVHRASLSGNVQGVSYSVSATKAGGLLSFGASVGARSAVIRFKSTDFPEADFRTLHEGLTLRPEQEVSFEIKYGPETECYSNDDGRNVLLVSFKPSGEVSASKLDLSACKVTWISIPIARNSRGIFSAF